MTRKDAINLLPIIKAYAEGRDIEYNDLDNNWTVSKGDLVFSDYPNKYRVKSEPKLVPFIFEDNKLFKDRWIITKGYTVLSRIERVAIGGILLGANPITYPELLRNYEFEDGSPCGKYINE